MPIPPSPVHKSYPLSRTRGEIVPALRRFSIILIVAVLLLSLFALYCYMRYIEPRIIRVTDYSVTLDSWHPEHDGMRILLLADLHLHPGQADYRRMEKIIKISNDLKPDLVLLLGDYLNGSDIKHSAPPDKIAAFCSRLHAPLGIFAILGNHDWWIDGHRMTDSFRHHGIPVLENSYVTLVARGKSFNIVGLPDYDTRGHLLYDGIVRPNNNQPSLLLSHSPFLFKDLRPDYELTFSGHTHGGQINLPLIGAIAISRDYRSLATGYLEEPDGRKIIISNGLGTSLFPLRFLAAPELVLVTLRSKERKF